jgi:hypothetical protein
VEFYGFDFKNPSKTHMLIVCLPVFGAIWRWWIL